MRILVTGVEINNRLPAEMSYGAMAAGAREFQIVGHVVQGASELNAIWASRNECILAPLPDPDDTLVSQGNLAHILETGEAPNDFVMRGLVREVLDLRYRVQKLEANAQHQNAQANLSTEKRLEQIACAMGMRVIRHPATYAISLVPIDELPPNMDW